MKVPTVLLIIGSIVSLSKAWVPSKTCKRVTTQYRTTTLLHAKDKKDNHRTSGILDSIEQPFDLVDKSEVAEKIEEDESMPLVRAIAKAADMRKAEDIVALRVSKLTSMTDFVVIVSGTSRPQNQAISVSIRDEVEEVFEGKYTLRNSTNGGVEGSADSGWILLDYGPVIVHVMTPKSRLFYNLEGRWKKGEDVDLHDVLLPNSVPGLDTNSSDDPVAVLEKDEEDPFWS